MYIGWTIQLTNAHTNKQQSKENSMSWRNVNSSASILQMPVEYIEVRKKGETSSQLQTFSFA